MVKPSDYTYHLSSDTVEYDPSSEPEQQTNGNGTGQGQVKQSSSKRKPRSKSFPKEVPPTTSPLKKWWYIPLPADIDLLKFEADDTGNAEAMHATFKDQLIFSPALGWMEYTGAYWRVTSESEASKVAIAALKMRQHAAVEAQNDRVLKAAIPSKRHVSDCLWLYKAFVTIGDVREFDSDPDLLNCQNGVLNLRTGSLTPHYPCQRFTYILPIEYKPDADVSAWTTFIHEAVGEEVAHYLQKAVGYTFTGHTREEKLFYAFGPPRAGKGTFTETLLALLPQPFGVGVDFNSFTAKREADTQNFDLAPLRPSRFVIASESNRYQSLNPAKIKSLTGGDYITCAFKHRDHFSYKPQFKVWLVSNHEVNGDADDEAMWGRVIVIDFPRSHLGEEDTTLKARLRLPENLEGLLRWIVDGSKLWYVQGLGILPESIRASTQSHRDMQDYIKQWLNECCEQGNDFWASSAELMKSYKAWCEEANVKPVSPKQLSGTLIQRFKCIAQRSKDVKRVRGLGKIHILAPQNTLFSGQLDTLDSKNGQKTDFEILHEKKSDSPVQCVQLSNVPENIMPTTEHLPQQAPTLGSLNVPPKHCSACGKHTRMILIDATSNTPYQCGSCGTMNSGVYQQRA